MIVMKKNGFTLVELIVSIGLLALIGVTIGVSLNRSIKKQNEITYEEYVAKVKSAANMYASNNSDIINSLYTDKGYVILTARELIEEGLISKNLINPVTKEKIKSDENIKVLLDGSGTISIEYPSDAVAEDYLQTMDIIVDYESKEIIDYCYEGINTYQLGYIKSDGVLINRLEKNSTIKCTGSNEVDTNKLGTYILNYEYLTINGVWKQGTRKVIVADRVLPECGEINGASEEWIAASRTITVECKDNYGCEKDKYTATFKDIKIGQIEIKDKNNNKTICRVNAYSDTLNPTSINISGNSEWTNEDVTITGRGKDELSGIKYYYFGSEENLTDISSIGTEITPTTEIEQRKTISEEGIHKYYFYVEDAAGNVTRSSDYIEAKIDKTKPKVTIGAYKYDTTATNKLGNNVKASNEYTSDGTYTVSNNWLDYGVTFKTNSTDAASGIKSIVWKWNNSNSATDTGNSYPSSITTQNNYPTLTEEGYRKGQWIVTDNAGNTTTVTTVVKIDNTAPSKPSMGYADGDWNAYTVGSWANTNIYAARSGTNVREGTCTTQARGPYNSSDNLSGIAKYQISQDGSNWIDYNYDCTNSLYKMSSNGSNTRYFRACDNAGNCGTGSKILSLTAKIDKTAPTISADLKVGTSSYDGSWTNQSVSNTNKPSYSDTGGSGINTSTLKWKIDGGTSWVDIAYSALTNNRDTTVYYRICDNAGNCAETSGDAIKIDTTAPSFSVNNYYSDDSTRYYGGCTINNIYSYLHYSDEGSGINVDSLRYASSSSDSWHSGGIYQRSSYTVCSTGANNCLERTDGKASAWTYWTGAGQKYLRVCDNAGNCSSVNFYYNRKSSCSSGSSSSSCSKGSYYTSTSYSYDSTCSSKCSSRYPSYYTSAYQSGTTCHCNVYYYS